MWGNQGVMEEHLVIYEHFTERKSELEEESVYN
jgi:hypothetical protein